MSQLVGVASARTQGCTCVAVNLAAALQRVGAYVALVDLDPRGGRVAAWLGVSDRSGLALAADMRGRQQTAEDLQRELREVRGLPVLTGVTRRHRGIVEMGSIAQAVRSLADIVVADLGVLPGEAEESAGECDRILLLVRPDQIGVAAAREVVALGGVIADRLSLLAAPMGPAARSVPADVERAVKVPVVGSVPFDPKEVARALVAHRPLTGPAASFFARLAERIVAGMGAGAAQPATQPPGRRTFEPLGERGGA